MTGKKISYFLFFAMIFSCSSTSSFTETNADILENKSLTSNFITQKIDFIDSYVSKIDFKANDSGILNVNELEIQGNKRIITTNESEKNIVLKNDLIVRVKYKDHLANNFIKSSIYYYDNNQLICIKLYEILPNEFNEATLYKRTVYYHNDLPISDSDVMKPEHNTQSLALLGRQYLKKEYLSLN
jgi:hypothetical protein